MPGNWRVLDFTAFKGELRFDKSSRKLLVCSSDPPGCTPVSLSDVAIAFIGIGVRIGAGVMFHFAQNDIVVLHCDWKGMPVSGMYPWIDAHGRVAARQRAQAGLSLPRSKNAWMRIVKAKVVGQSNNLALLQRVHADGVAVMARSVKSGDVSNVEGRAARAYWSSLFLFENFSRAPGARSDPLNSMLDYAYTILRGHSVRAVLAAGLAPALGLYHRSRQNAFALADDLIEPFRPAVDLAVADLEGCTALDSDIKHHLHDATVRKFDSDGKTIPTVMTEFAQAYGRYVEGEEAFLEVPIWKPQEVLDVCR
ncbi:type II CRISPR-associated endonuclease Cas1 [Curtanaerobium respiraculi]|uniref:type II CRISPR-associated endonuclease Cas1 n=1 Tax=Curtanaerobium respiraculi TaxID=2949669 RepID=UPI0024B37ED9|nr:type II CRISPR-associated endonuclease Cas1 [Curtanaerobium respiraculi]